MKLYEVPNKTRVRLVDDPQTPPEALQLKVGDEVFFDHIDGMYSYCLVGDEIVHLVAWAEVEILEDEK